MAGTSSHKGELDLGIVAIVAIVALAFVWALYLQTGSQWNFSVWEGSVGVPQNYPSYDNATKQTDPSKVDLCLAYKPVFDALAAYGSYPNSNCLNGGGVWKCDSNHVGCYNFGGSINCSQTLYNGMIYACNSYKAIGVCNQKNAYCEYG